ncbi:hypothetical protein [Photorhabdus heterorhabditis]|uniref:Radical SAM protein n=1 Tax=Photorhabdus heterorhabditis TaxID=880156 RepID=A0A5B0WAL4_9GAMM|nr:hypothetical protein [Photorhabdus heterorhabditis]KAA1183161.1 hypothetical protein F0L16_16230 [Photorhabdus heterorhabditis]KOY61041.1 hypothetical protein AM629_16115 [Photorhabdus heterorhabditis]
MIIKDIEELKPYPRKCYLPFILYPPGLHKNDMEGELFVNEYLNLQQEGTDFVLYISIPYCRTQCKSCPYFVSILSESDNNNREDKYVYALLKDMKKWAQYPKWKTGLIRTIFIGGGTGSILKTTWIHIISATSLIRKSTCSYSLK